jgi:hypothetical protein
MKNNLQKALIFLCLGIMLTGAVVAEWDAYPGAPTSVPTPTTLPQSTPTPSSTTAQSAGQTITTGAYQSTITQIPASQSGATTTTTLTSTVTAINYQTPPVAQQNLLLTYNIQTAPPAVVYYSGYFVPWTSFYQVFPKNSPALWISSQGGWSWYATCPLGSWLQELIYVPSTGTMKVYDLYPDGTTKFNSYGWATPGYKYRWFNAGAPGRYLTMVTISDNPSNFITIDVA